MKLIARPKQLALFDEYGNQMGFNSSNEHDHERKNHQMLIARQKSKVLQTLARSLVTLTGNREKAVKLWNQHLEQSLIAATGNQRNEESVKRMIREGYRPHWWSEQKKDGVWE